MKQIKHAPLIPFLIVGLFLVAASCDFGKSPSTTTNDATDSQDSTDISAESLTPESDPVAFVQELLAAAQSGNQSTINAMVTAQAASKKEGDLYPMSALLKNSDVEYDPPLEFGEEFRMVKAVFTEKNAQTPQVQRFVYFLESASANNTDKWIVFDVKKGGSASSDANHKHDDPIVGSVKQDAAANKSLQQKIVDRENKWRNDPYLVALADSIALGFDPHNDSFTLVDQQEQGEGSGTAIADIEIIHGEDIYTARLIQPVDQGEKGIWVINSISKQ